MNGDDFAQAAEIIPNLFYFAPLKRADGTRCSPIAAANLCFSIDEELLYEPFYLDFGPLNLGKSYRFCQRVQALLQEAQRTGKRLYYACGPHAHFRANGAVLVGIYQVMFLNLTADDAYKRLLPFKPYVPFRDASCGVSTFHLTVLDCLKGVQKARDVGFLDWSSSSSTWTVDEYEHYEQVENGDLNWIVPGKFVAFSGPAARSNEIAGYRLHTPEDYWEYFRRKGVTTVVRLNKKVYERKRFLDGGFKHHEMYFPDGSCPSDAILQRFLETVEAEPGAIAVHCKAGLGRTGVLICSYIMKHYKFTAEEVIGYIRICRPGSVIGPQQNFIREIEARLWHEGDLYRAARGIKHIAPQSADLIVAGRPAAGASYSGPVPRAGSANQRQVQQGPGVNGNDLSLMQYSQSHASSSAGASVSSQHMPTHLVGPAPSLSSPSAAPRNRYSQRSITPLRYGTPSGTATTAPAYGLSASQPAPFSAARQTYTPASAASNPAARSMPSMPLQRTLPVRAPSADRGASRGFSAASLRATLHTDTLQAADRPRSIPERNTQSADISNSSNHGSWKLSSQHSYGSPAPPAANGRAPSAGRSSGATSARQAPSGGINHAGGAVARVLAPNGQPRKVPMALLSQYQVGAGRQVDVGSSASSGRLRYGLSSS